MDAHMKAFAKLLKENAYAHRPHEVFRDFCEMAACSLSNRVDLAQHDEREKRYMQIVGKYDREQVARFPQMLSELYLSLCAEMSDALGQTFMDLDFGNQWHGQFFTPYHLARMMAQMTLGEAPVLLEHKPFITLLEPACGAGAMVIAAAQVLADQGVSPIATMHATCIDIDITAVQMAYIQLSLLGLPAVVLHGNSLTDECWSRWYTPAHVLDGWSAKLRTREETRPAPPPTIAPPAETANKSGQLALFSRISS